jgi:hypothetical protein
MKNIIRTFIVISFLTVSPFFLTAQVMGPSDPGAAPQGQPIGGGAPVGGGLFILLGLSAVYGGNKVYRITKTLNNER